MGTRARWSNITSNDRMLSLTHDVRKRRRDAGTGGSGGVIVPLTLTNDALYNPIYTVPVGVGGANDTYQLQVDTGSSDLWIASRFCTSAPCTNNKAKLYDPSSAMSTGVDFQISYLSGQVAGRIFWDTVSLGGYRIDSQALSAATTVINETLGPDFSGILGLAPPKDSVIAQLIPPNVGNSTPDGATLMSNIFGLPASLAPGQSFYSLLLERPGSSRIPSLLGIGRHPSNDMLPDGPNIQAAKVSYSNLVSDVDGAHFWKSELRAVTVYVNGTAKQIDIGHSVNGNVFPSAILDTGVPYIIATPAIANAIWGALGVSPAADGNYYLPCTTPLNMTVTLDGRSEIPLHPLDLSAIPQQDVTSTMCVGLVQQSSALALSSTGDVILGVPFLRNVYTVMAYGPPSSQDVVRGPRPARGKRAPPIVSPQLGLLGITNATSALEEFNKVRVLKQPLGGRKQSTSSSSHGLPVGVVVLLGLIGFAGFCVALFALRWFILRRKMKKVLSVNTQESDVKNSDKRMLSLLQLDLSSGHRPQSRALTEDTQRTLIDPFARLDAKYATTISSRTKISYDNELGFRASHFGDDTLIGKNADERPSSWVDSFSEYQPALHGEWRPPAHERSYSSSSVVSNHSATQSAPLLDESRSTEREADELGVTPGMGMTGIGTAHRGSVIDEELTQDMRHSRVSSANIPSRPHARTRNSRVSFGPRPQSTMSHVINAEDLR